MITKKNVRRFMRDLVKDEMEEAWGSYGSCGPEITDAARVRNQSIARFLDFVLRNTPPEQLLATAKSCKIEKCQIALDVAIDEEDL